MTLTLVKPEMSLLPAMADALRRGFTPDNLRGEAAAREALERIAADPQGFLAFADDPDGRAGDVTLPDGSVVERLPGLYRWMWDGDFCGLIGLRWARDGAALPAYVLGHIGYAVAPWKRRRGYATAALRLMLPIAREQGLGFVELTTEEANLPSQKVILANGGRVIETFDKLAAHGGGRALKFRIDLDSGAYNRP